MVWWECAVVEEVEEWLEAVVEVDTEVRTGEDKATEDTVTVKVMGVDMTAMGVITITTGVDTEDMEATTTPTMATTVNTPPGIKSS